MQRVSEFIAINQNRIKYMLSLFCLSMDELLAKINERRNPHKEFKLI